MDLAGRQPFIKEFVMRNVDMGCCIVSALILIYIRKNKKEEFSTQVQLSVNERFVAFLSVLDPNRFLTSGPCKTHIEHVLLALSRAGIQDVSVYVYGQKSLYTYFHFLDDLPPETS